MLLKHVCDFSYSRKILDDLAFSLKPIRWIIPLDKDGNLVGQGLIDTKGERNKGKEFLAPRTSLYKAVGGIAEFLADGLTALFGLGAEPEKKLSEKQHQERDANNAGKCEHFWGQISDAFAETGHPALGALLTFHEQTRSQPSFLRYGNSADPKKASEKARWWVKTASGDETALGAEQFTFEVDGEQLLLNEDILRPYWRKVYAREMAEKEANSTKGLCLVTGMQNVPIADTHDTKIRGVPGTQSFGAAIVSFDKPAFASYGFEQSLNAPISTDAVAAYCNGLNYLLSRDDHSLKIGAMVLCFWAKKDPNASSFFAGKLKKPDPMEVAAFLKNPWAGLDRHSAKLDQFYSVTLSGNGGRVVVRHWMQTTLETAIGELKNWFEDLAIVHFSRFGDQNESAEKKRSKAKANGMEEELPPLSVKRLAYTIVRDPKKLEGDVPYHLYRAALENTSIPVSVTKPLLYRLNADLCKFGIGILETPIPWKTVKAIREAGQPIPPPGASRFALLKLILNRNRKEGEPVIQPQVFETDDAAYNCGRLLATFDDLQMAAHEWKLEGAGVVERYYGSASSAPNSAFGILWRLHQHHFRKLSQQGEKGRAAAAAVKRRIGEICSMFSQGQPGMPPEFPRIFTLIEQGRFAIGFYQQKAADDAARKDYMKNKQNVENQTSREEENK